MDGKRFDDLARMVSSGTSRRSILKGLLGLGGAAVTGTIVSEGTDARGGSVTRFQPPPPPVCPSGLSPCGGTTFDDCCPDTHCSNGVCCDEPGQVRCGTSDTCCDPGTCNTLDEVCCTDTEDLCYNQDLCCPSGTCSRLGNTDACCPAPELVSGSGECCDIFERNCDTDCCRPDEFCLTRAFPSAGLPEETCCPADLTCDNQCCDGECYDPEGSNFESFVLQVNGIAFDPIQIARLCCPSGFEVCENSDGTNTCIDPATQCCESSDCPAIAGQGEEACFSCVDNTCVAVPRGDQGGCPECEGCSGIQQCVANPEQNGTGCTAFAEGVCCDGACIDPAAQCCLDADCLTIVPGSDSGCIACRENICQGINLGNPCNESECSRCDAGFCTDVNSACGSVDACTPALCVEGSCNLLTSCVGNTPTCCGTDCTNTQSDPLNCGTCGRACASNQTCTGGTCVSCQSQEVTCESRCGTVTNNCGQPFDCGGCPTGSLCQGTTCIVCETLQEACAGSCGAVINNCNQQFDCGSCTIGTCVSNACICDASFQCDACFSGCCEGVPYCNDNGSGGTICESCQRTISSCACTIGSCCPGLECNTQATIPICVSCIAPGASCQSAGQVCCGSGAICTGAGETCP